MIRADGAGRTRLLERGRFPVWSPDGARLAYVGGGDVFVIGVDGSECKRLVSTPAADYLPAWSPDGTKIAFLNEHAALYIVAADGSGEVQAPVGIEGDPSTEDVSFVFTPDMRPAWSPDGRQILYSAWDPSHGEEIWGVRVDGTGPTRLTDLTASHSSAVSPVWAPDGTRFAFAAAGPDGGLYVANADGTEATRLAGAEWGDVTAPAWSPDGHRLLFAFQGPDGAGIAVVNTDGTSATRLVQERSGLEDPVWSPDGTRIAFAADGVGVSPAAAGDASSSLGRAIVVVRADGSDPVRAAGTARDDLGPVWSPDGARIAFWSAEIVTYTD